MKTTIKILLASFLFVIALIISFTHPEFVGLHKDIFNDIIAIFGLIVIYIQFLYHNVDQLFVIWNNFKAIIANPGIQWRMSANLEFSDISTDVLKKIFAEIISLNNAPSSIKKKPKLKSKSATRLIFTLDFHVIEIVLLNNRRIQVSTTSNTNYRQSKKVIESLFGYIVKSTKQATALSCQGESFTLTIGFTEHNPFYGIYVKQLENIPSTEFLLRYTINDTEFVVTNDTIEAHTHDYESIRKVASKYLILSIKK